MAPRGRPPKPAHLKLVEGNPGKGRIGKEPKPRSVIPTPPDDLGGLAKEEWRRIAPELQAMGLLHDCDRSTLVSYCQAWERWYIAYRLLTKLREEDPETGGLIITTSTGNVIQHPAVGIANKAAKEMLGFASELGLTPVARARLGIADAKGKGGAGRQSKFGDTIWQPGQKGA